MSAAVSSAKLVMRYSPGGVAELPDAAVVERRDPPAVAEPRDLIDPARALVGEAGDEDDVVALPCLLGVQLHAVRVDHSHAAILRRRRAEPRSGRLARLQRVAVRQALGAGR